MSAVHTKKFKQIGQSIAELHRFTNAMFFRQKTLILRALQSKDDNVNQNIYLTENLDVYVSCSHKKNQKNRTIYC